MNLSEVPIAEIVVGSAAGLTAIYYGGRVILNGLRSRHQDHIDVPSTPTRPANTTESPQVSGRGRGRDQRSVTFIPLSNRGQRPARKNRRNSK